MSPAMNTPMLTATLPRTAIRTRMITATHIAMAPITASALHMLTHPV